MKTFRIAVLPGDGIGTEVMPLCCDLLDQLANHYGSFKFDNFWMEAGATCYQKSGAALPDEVLQQSRECDAILLGAMGLPSVRYADGTEIAPQLDLRFDLGLYAGVRPVKPITSLPLPLRNPEQQPIDFVLIRESTEGLFASHGKGKVYDDQYATDTMRISREGSERLFRFSFKLAEQRNQQGHTGRLSCVDKANVFASMAFFRKIYNEIAMEYPEVETDYMYVDAAALNMVRQPWKLDVLVTENMFGDILSDLGAGLMGGMGMAPSADIGDNHGVFQPCHGSAPDITGLGKANPVAMILSGAMMFEWLGQREGIKQMVDAGKLVETAVHNAFVDQSLIPFELGGDGGTLAIYKGIVSQLERLL